MTTTALNQNVRAFTSENGSLVTAENRSVAIDGASLVYRCFGNKQTNTPPLLFLQHFRGNLDNWDPALVDRLAQDREVILLANRGVGASTGVVPDNVTDMTRDVLRFVDALGLKQVDVLGFSLGGFGLGTALSAFAIASQNGVDVAQMGVATGLGTSGRAIGATLGSAGFGSLLVARIGADTVTPRSEIRWRRSSPLPSRVNPNPPPERSAAPRG